MKLVAEKQKIIEFFNETSEKCMAWAADMKCPGKPEGYYRFNSHAFHPWILYASIGMYEIFKTLKRTEILSPAQKTEWASVFLDHYDADAGLFVCPHLSDGTTVNPENPDDREKADATAPVKKVVPILIQLGIEDWETKDDGISRFNSFIELKSYLNGRKMALHPYSFGSVLGSMFHKRTLWLKSRKMMIWNDEGIKELYAYVDSILDVKTGMVTGNSRDPVLQMNGLFKLCCSSYWAHGLPVPNGRKIIDSILDIQDKFNYFDDACGDYNASLLLSRLCVQENGYRREDILKAMDATVLPRLISRMKPDGGFSFHVEHCLTNINGYPVSDPLPESDCFGTGQQLAVLNALAAISY